MTQPQKGDLAIKLAKDVRKSRALANSAAVQFGPHSLITTRAKAEAIKAQRLAHDFMS